LEYFNSILDVTRHDDVDDVWIFVYSDESLRNLGATAAVTFVGRDSMVINVYRLKSYIDIIGTLKAIANDRSARLRSANDWEQLEMSDWLIVETNAVLSTEMTDWEQVHMHDQAQVSRSERVQDIFQSFTICAWQSEPQQHHQAQPHHYPTAIMSSRCRIID
jgi:hypothetical protein